MQHALWTCTRWDGNALPKRVSTQARKCIIIVSEHQYSPPAQGDAQRPKSMCYERRRAHRPGSSRSLGQLVEQLHRWLAQLAENHHASG
jgi:hypothetical protein